jgi:hypothetical protein
MVQDLDGISGHVILYLYFQLCEGCSSRSGAMLCFAKDCGNEDKYERNKNETQKDELMNVFRIFSQKFHIKSHFQKLSVFIGTIRYQNVIYKDLFCHR